MRNGDPDWYGYEDMAECAVVPTAQLGRYMGFDSIVGIAEPDFDTEYRLAMKDSKKKDRARHARSALRTR